MSSSFFPQLAELEVRVALDDFGTGFLLARLGGDTPSYQTIVRVAIDLGHQLGAAVVAEGVESEAVRSELEALGCDSAQGFLFAQPMAADQFAAWLRERHQPAVRGGARGRRAARTTVTATRADH